MVSYYFVTEKQEHTESQAPQTAPSFSATLRVALSAAWPVMIGYVFLGIPCGILAQQVGIDALQVFLLSMLFYSGAGQYMISNMWLPWRSSPRSPS